MLASPAPVRAFVCVIRKSMGLDLRCCLVDDVHKMLMCDVDKFLHRQVMACLVFDKTVLRVIKCSCVAEISDFVFLQSNLSARHSLIYVLTHCFPL